MLVPQGSVVKVSPAAEFRAFRIIQLVQYAINNAKFKAFHYLYLLYNTK